MKDFCCYMVLGVCVILTGFFLWEAADARGKLQAANNRIYDLERDLGEAHSALMHADIRAGQKLHVQVLPRMPLADEALKDAVEIATWGRMARVDPYWQTFDLPKRMPYAEPSDDPISGFLAK